MNDDETTPKKKSDKTASDNITVSLEKSDVVKLEKSDTEEPKPRIVLTFRSEKSNTKSANMKIVSTEEKNEEVSPRRSGRTRGKWDWVCDSDTSISPKKDRSQPVSENDESDSSHTPSKRTRRRSKDDNVLATAIARKEKSYNEATPGPTQRLSRRLKPTAKILANEELRLGLESQNNARLGIQSDKSPEEGVRTRRSAKSTSDSEKPKAVQKVIDEEVVELDSDSQNSDMKVKHLCKLGLKAIDHEEGELEEDTEKINIEEEENDEILEDKEEDEIADDDSEVIRKLLESDEYSDEDYVCAVSTSKGRRTRRSTRLHSSFGNESDHSSTVPDDDSKAPTRRSRRRAGPELDDSGRTPRTRRRKRHSEDEPPPEENEEESNPAGGEEGTEAARPEEPSSAVAKCYCDTPSNIYATADDLIEPVFCQAIEILDGVRVGCSHAARKCADGYEALVRAGPRAPFFLACTLHAKQLAKHMCCPACGLFCSQGVFYQCSEGHLFHLDCGLPVSDSKTKLGCPHCGVTSYRWQPANKECCKVKVEMKTSNKRIFLPDQREQCTQAYIGFSKLSSSQVDFGPIIPPDLLPPAKDLKKLSSKPLEVVKCTPQELCDAILAGETIEQLMPKIASSTRLNKRLPSQEGGTVVHVAAKTGHLGALYLLHNAGANLSIGDNYSRSPLMLATLALLDKSELNPKDSKAEDMEVDVKDENTPEESKEEDDKETTVENVMSAEDKLKDEELMKVIRFLLAAGVDVNMPESREQLTPLHVAAQLGGAALCGALAAAGGAPDARDAGGWTPLVWAAENGHRDAVAALLAAGAAVSTADKEGNWCVHWCALAGAAACLQLLLRAEPRAHAALNAHADTPLHVAARQGHYSCVVILLAHGARSDVENSAGELPIDVCTGPCQNAISLNMQMTMALKDKPCTYRVLTGDISNGRERYPVPCINEVDDAPAPEFTYVTKHVMPENIAVDYTIQTLQGCKCKGGACGEEGGDSACPCVALCVRQWWRRGRLLPSFPHRDPPMLFQCNLTCCCNPKLCGNSVVSNLCAEGSLFSRAEVFRVGGARGWGLRAAAPALRGAPVAAYCGELLPLHLADTRQDDCYMFALDVKHDLLEQPSDKEQLCIDASAYGGAARFVNHSCRPNLAPVRVYTHSRDLHLPTVTLFATRDIEPGEQFTFDYGDKFWSVKSKWMKCECGTPECRYPVQTTDETES